MPPPIQTAPAPDFEIDHPETFGQFLLTEPDEILFHLQLLARQRSLFTAYIDDGQHFFLTSIVGLDESGKNLFLGPSNVDDDNSKAISAHRITLATNLERVKIQIRLPAPLFASYQGQRVLATPLPGKLLRLQRRDFFRLEPPHDNPILCKLAAQTPGGDIRTFELPLSDISGGGVSLMAATETAAYFPRDALFQQCRMDFPGNGVIQANLRVRKAIEVSDRNGNHHLRIGCEFVNLPSNRAAFIERYIARIERERKAQTSGLAD